MEASGYHRIQFVFIGVFTQSFISTNMKILYLYLFIVLLYIVIRDLTLLFLCSALRSSAVTRTIHFSLHQLQFHTHSPSFFLFLFPFLLQRAILSNAAPSNKSVIPRIKTALSYSALFLFYSTDCVFVSIMSYPFMTFY